MAKLRKIERRTKEFILFMPRWSNFSIWWRKIGKIIQATKQIQKKNGLDAGGKQSVFILLDSCTFLPCSGRTHSRRYCYAIFSLTFSLSFYLSIIFKLSLSDYYRCAACFRKSFAKVLIFLRKNKGKTVLLAQTALFLMFVNQPFGENIRRFEEK